MKIILEETDEITEEDTKISNEECIIFVSGTIEQKREKCIHELIKLFSNY